jgi:glycosyltransferase involved in cell wall biosynthesis
MSEETFEDGRTSPVSTRWPSNETRMTNGVSVIIPTRDRARGLKRLLDSLHCSVAPDSMPLEIVVVNNGSTDETACLLKREAAARRFDALVVLQQPIPGKSHAINLALSIARGEILTVLDDDVSVHPDCLAKLVEAYDGNGFSAVQGRVLAGRDPDGQSADAGRLYEYNIPLVDHGVEIRSIRGLTGTNMSFKREVLERVGSFDVRLGPGASGFSEDSEFSRRVRRAGFKIGYTPHAIAYHELNPARYGRGYHRDAQYRKGLSRSLYVDESLPRRVLPRLWGNCQRYCMYRILGNRERAYRTEGRILKACGYVMGKWRPPGPRYSS